MDNRLRRELAPRDNSYPAGSGEQESLNYDEYACPYCGETIKRSSFFCDCCGRDLSRAEPEFGPPPFTSAHHEGVAERVAHKTEDRSHFTSYVSTFATVSILAGVIWVGVVPFVKSMEKPAAMELGWLVAAVAVPMLVFALVIVAFAMPSGPRPRASSSNVPPFGTVVALVSLAVAAYAFHAPFSMAVYLISAGAFGALVSLALGNRVFAITTIVISAVGYLAVHELQSTASGSQSMVDQLQHLNLHD